MEGGNDNTVWWKEDELFFQEFSDSYIQETKEETNIPTKDVMEE